MFVFSPLYHKKQAGVCLFSKKVKNAGNFYRKEGIAEKLMTNGG